MSAGRDRSAPGVRITVLSSATAKQGTPVDLAGRIVSVTFEDAETKADKVSIVLDNFDLALFDRSEILGGALLEVSWGYPGNMAPPRRVAIKKVKGFTTLTLEGQALSSQMNQEVKTRGWQNKRRSDVAREIAAEHGYEGASAVIDDTAEVFDAINQCAETDAWFLRRLAARENFLFLVDDSGLHWHLRKQNAAPTHVFTWFSDPDRGEVLSIDTESNLASRAGSVSVKGRDPIQRSTIDASANKDSVKRSTLSHVTNNVDFETGKDWFSTRVGTASTHPSSAATAGRAQREADARFVRNERASIKLTMQVVGDPTLRAKAIVELRNISTLLSGRYHLNEVKHTISGSGYVCDLKLTRDGTSKGASGTGNAQGGDKNALALPKPGQLVPVEHVDFERGGTVLSYRPGKPGVGGGDPEALPPGKR